MPATGQLDDWDNAHAWHPFSQMSEYCASPKLHVDHGAGCWLYDRDGRRYLDCNASVWTNTFGHNDPDLNRALTGQLAKVAHSTYLGLSHPAAAELAAALAARSPGGLPRVFFSDNGSNAVEIAMKLSFQYWQLAGRPGKQRVIGMQGGYHGDTVGTMAAGDSGRFHERFRAWFLDSWHFTAPCCHELAGEVRAAAADRSLAELSEYLEAGADRVACLVLEPSVQGAAGMVQQPPGFVAEVAKLCSRHDVHLILDEVFTGFGRLGRLFACTAEGVEPDFLCLAKGLSAGYLPLAATLVGAEVYRACLGRWSEDRAFFHGHTFTANPLGCAVALKNLEKLEALIASGALEHTIDRFGREVAAAFDGHPQVRIVRQRGLTCCVELQRGPGAPPWDADARVGWRVSLAARDRELLLRPLGDSLLLVPPLVISDDEIAFMCTRTAETIGAEIAAIRE